MQVKSIAAIALAALVSLGLTGCKIESDNESDSRKQGQIQQENIMQRANDAVPTYSPDHFLTRKAVDKWMRRMDQPQKTFYIYLVADNGQQLGYYVGQTRPISNCTLLTPPDRLQNGDGVSGTQDYVVKSPSLDGVYSGGGCESFFFFDAETDAYVEIKGLNFFVSDQPLSIDVEPIKVQNTQ